MLTYVRLSRDRLLGTSGARRYPFLTNTRHSLVTQNVVERQRGICNMTDVGKSCALQEKLEVIPNFLARKFVQLEIVFRVLVS